MVESLTIPINHNVMFLEIYIYTHTYIVPKWAYIGNIEKHKHINYYFSEKILELCSFVCRGKEKG